MLIHSAPRSLSFLLPARLSFAVGLFFFTLAIFAGFLAAYVLRSPSGVFSCFIQMYVGLWFMLASSAAARGSYDDEQMLKRIFVMIGLLMTAIIGCMYVSPQVHAIAILQLLLVTAGFWVTTNYFQLLDRGR
jgi:hypothetical protein